MIVRYFGEQMMDLMGADIMNDRMNMTIVTIDCWQLTFDIVPFGISVPRNIARNTAEKFNKETHRKNHWHFCVVQHGDDDDVTGEDEHWNQLIGH